MKVDVRARPSYAIAYLFLSADERAYVERSAIVTLTDGIDVRGSFGGDGVVSALKRKAFGGETLLFTEVHAQVEGAWVTAAPPYPGDIEAIQVTAASPVMIESGSLLAYSAGVVGDVRYSGLKTVVLHEGVAMIETSGDGVAVLSAYGAIEELDLAEGMSVIVDTGHIMGFTYGITMDVGALSSIAKAVTTGEGLVARMTGPGRVYLQTRAERDLRSWLFPQHGQLAPNAQ